MRDGDNPKHWFWLRQINYPGPNLRSALPPRTRLTRAVIPECFHQSTLARHDTSCISSDVDVEKQRHPAIPAIFDAGTELRTLTSVELRRRDEGNIVLHVGCTDYQLLNVHYGWQVCKYVQIRTNSYEYKHNTYEYVRIRTNTYKYVHIRTLRVLM